MAETIGILTAGGDSPGLNAAIRALGKAAQKTYGMHVIGFRDGFRGLMHDQYVRLDSQSLAGIITKGGTILGTSRDKVHKMPVGDGRKMDMRPLMKQVVERHGLAALVALGGGGTVKNAARLAEAGIPIVVLPKTIDNDVCCTDTTFGFDTALSIATEAIDRLHSTAHSHHRIVVVETMGHRTGWLALGAGLAGGADVILIPEIPYQVEPVAEAILHRKASGSPFSIVAISEGAMTVEAAAEYRRLKTSLADAATPEDRQSAKQALAIFDEREASATHRLAKALEERTKLESRVTILGHVQRGGTPTAADRLLATRLGTACADYIADGVTGVMIASRGDGTEPIPLEQVAGARKTVPLDHPWISSARHIGLALGD